MSEYFPKPKSLGANVKIERDLSNYANVKIERDLSNYATKADLQNKIGVDTSKFAKK